MFVSPPKFLCWNSTLQLDGIGRRALWEVIRSWKWSSQNGNSVFTKKGRVLNPSLSHLKIEGEDDYL